MPDRVAGDFVLYDGDCPVCKSYVAWSRLREASPEIQLINARDVPELVSALRKDGIEVNDSMVLRLGDTTLHGADAFVAITRLGRPRPGVATYLLKLMTAPPVAGPLYPLMVAGRKTLLFLLRRTQIS